MEDFDICEIWNDFAPGQPVFKPEDLNVVWTGLELKDFVVCALNKINKQSDGWITFENNPKLLIEILENSKQHDCLVKFDNGRILRYSEDWPMSHCVSHFKSF